MPAVKLLLLEIEINYRGLGLFLTNSVYALLALYWLEKALF